MRADFHIHTNYSDGSDSSADVFQQAHDTGVEIVAITDHDTVAGFDEHTANAAAYGIHYINGLEISAYDYRHAKPCHIVGLGVDIYDRDLLALISQTLKQRHQISLLRIEKLKSMGYDIDIADFSEARHDKTIYKQHIMQVLIARGYAQGVYGKFYRENFKNGGPLDFRIDYPSHLEAVRVVKQAGGIPVLAHPSLYNNFDAVEAMVKEGLMGIEYTYPSATDASRALVEKMAETFDLFLSGGSDYHGSNSDKSGGVIGQFCIDHIGVIK